MAKISNMPKVGEFLILDLNRTQIDFQVTNVVANHTMDGHSKITIEGFPHRERSMSDQGISGMAGYTYPSNGVGNYVSASNISQGTISFTQPVGIEFAKKDLQKTPSKGMDVDITSIETVDGVKAQIVLHAGTKRVIAWESEAFEDDEDLSVKGAQTAEVKARKAAEGHAKSVLKTIFSQS